MPLINDSDDELQHTHIGAALKPVPVRHGRNLFKVAHKVQLAKVVLEFPVYVQ